MRPCRSVAQDPAVPHPFGGYRYVDQKSARRRPLTFSDVREIALSMPDVEETTAYGMPAFKAGKTRFAGRPVERHDVEPNSLGVPMSFEERARRLEERPDVYYVTQHFEGYPAVLVRLSRIDRRELREILAAAWQHAMERQSAPRARPRKTRRAKISPR